MDTIIRILKGIKPAAEINETTELIKEGIVDSLSMIMLVTSLCNEFDVDITAKDITPENFSSPLTIYNLISRIEDED